MSTIKKATAMPQHANALLDVVIEKLSLKNDAALCRVLDVAPPVISKIRNRRLRLSDGLLIRIHEEADMEIKDLKQILATGNS